MRVFLSRLIGAFRGRNTRLDEEIQNHLELLADDYRRRGLSSSGARLAARRAFGGVQQVRETSRDMWSFPALTSAWLDIKLAGRMLVKYPGLTVVGGFGVAVGVAIASATFAVIGLLLAPALPLDDGDRIVALQNWDISAASADRRALYDFGIWRNELTTVVDVGAFEPVSRNLLAAGGPPELYAVAQMTASGFRVARVPPILGRHLLDEDERPGAAPVVVIGYDVWRNRFGGNADVVGSTVHLGETRHTVVGVMPQGFRFPLNHRLWIPLRVGASEYEPRTGPKVYVFGRLADGKTLQHAQAELAILGRRMGAGQATYQMLRPQVVPYSHPFTDMDDPENARALWLMMLTVFLMLVLACVNVGILVYARTATRHAEIALRTALGASRRRIVFQLFVEALVLSAAGAMGGMILLGGGLTQLDAAVEQLFGELPFWFSFRVSAATVAYVVLFTIAAGVIVGVVPALKATGWQLRCPLQDLSAASSGMRLGRTWTILIVAQVAFAVALLPPAVFQAWRAVTVGFALPGFPAGEYLTVQLAAGSPDRHAELLQRLEAEPGVVDVTSALVVPGNEPTVWVDVEGKAAPSGADAERSGFAVLAGRFGHEARFNHVAVDFFHAFDVRLMAGRPFSAADASDGSAAVIVNRAFAQDIGGGADLLGRRIRYVGRSGDAAPEHVELGRWYEIIGVVSDFPAGTTSMGLVDAKVYHPASPAHASPPTLALHVRGVAPGSLIPRLREIAFSVDPTLQLRAVRTLDAALGQEQRLLRVVAATLSLVALSVVLLSAAGIYAMASFTVTQRRKEIGIRAALGGEPRHVLGAVFASIASQLGIGVVLGVGAAAILEAVTHGDLMEGNGVVVVPVVVFLMLAVAVCAALGPARRGLRIEPAEARRSG
jgi:predicted permease